VRVKTTLPPENLIMNSSNTPSPQRSSHKPSHRARLLIIVLVVVLIGLAVFGVVMRVHDRHVLSDNTNRDAVPTVSVMTAKAAPTDQFVTLPGTVKSWQDAEIYARTTGYVKKWYVDIGSRVKQGQHLADLDTPDVDNELLQGQAQMRTDQANAALAKVTADRYVKLAEQGLVALQLRDQNVAQLNADNATVQADAANVAKLKNMEEFKYITAPFDGVITQRNLDVGALVDAGSTGSNLFVIADTSKLRVFIDVPETYANSVRVGTPVTVTLSNYGTKPFTGTIARTAEALDSSTRTLRTEIDVENANAVLVPGVYANVKLALSTVSRNFVLPANTLLFRSEGLRVALIDAQQRVHLQPITLGRDFGSTVEVTEGIDANMRIVLNPSDSLNEGEKVNIAKNDAKDNAKDKQ
jgi:RND family efflux transporter MFP subunit